MKGCESWSCPPLISLLRGTGCIEGQGWVGGWRAFGSRFTASIASGTGGRWRRGTFAQKSRSCKSRPTQSWILDLCGLWGSRSSISPFRPGRGEAWTTIILRLTYWVLRYTSCLQPIARQGAPPPCVAQTGRANLFIKHYPKYTAEYTRRITTRRPAHRRWRTEPPSSSHTEIRSQLIGLPA